MAEVTPHSKAGGKNDHEKTDANAFSLFVAGGGLLALLIASFVSMYFLWRVFENNPPGATTPLPETALKGVLPPKPRLQINPQADLAAFHAYEDSVLNGYGWVDQGSGTVRIPIDSAITLVARRGLPYDTTLERTGK
ncbi:MAG: hypothetical protein WB699_11960 [Bacteroidota bacterium]